MFLYINLFWAPVKVHSSHRFVTQTEMIVSRAQIILMPASMQSIDLLFSFTEIPSILGTRSSEKSDFRITNYS